MSKSSFGRRGPEPAAPRSPRQRTVGGGGPPSWVWKVGLVVAGLLCVAGIGVAVLWSTLSDARGELDAFLKPMFVNLAKAEWREAEFDKYGGSAFNAWTLDNDLEAAVAPMRALGPVKEYLGVGNFNIETQGASGRALAVVQVRFANGEAAFQVALEKQEGEWYLQRLNLVQ